MDAKGTRQNIEIIDKVENNEIKIEVMEYQKLLGMTNTNMASTLYYMTQQNMKIRQVAIYINNSSFKIEPGAMSYFQGNLTMESGVKIGNTIGRMFTGAVTGEKMAQPEYSGTGMLVLEPTFRHILLIELEKGESIIVDKGMFYGAQGSVDVKSVMQKNVSSALLGGEGLFQIQIIGPGAVILESVVPIEEIDIIHLENDTLKVDGNFAILRSEGISFTVEKSAKSLLDSAMSGEGLVNVFRGTGQVWLAPTIKVYDTLAYGGDVKYMNMNTSNTKR